jgi:hypothetical protein
VITPYKANKNNYKPQFIINPMLLKKKEYSIKKGKKY